MKKTIAVIYIFTPLYAVAPRLGMEQKKMGEDKYIYQTSLKYQEEKIS